MDKLERSAYMKEWYARNQEEQRAKARVRSFGYRDFLIRLRSLILSATPCMDCDAPPDEDFEFDHRDGMADGRRRVSDLVTRGTSPARLMAEIPHCDIVCPTCHKKRTYARAKQNPAEGRTLSGT